MNAYLFQSRPRSRGTIRSRDGRTAEGGTQSKDQRSTRELEAYHEGSPAVYAVQSEEVVQQVRSMAGMVRIKGGEASKVVQAPSDKILVDPCRRRFLANGGGPLGGFGRMIQKHPDLELGTDYKEQLSRGRSPNPRPTKG